MPTLNAAIWGLNQDAELNRPKFLQKKTPCNPNSSFRLSQGLLQTTHQIESQRALHPRIWAAGFSV